MEGKQSSFGLVNHRIEQYTQQMLQDQVNVNMQDNYGWTALHYAAWSGHDKVVEILLQHHADVNKQDNDGSTALHRAAWSGHDKVVEILLQHHADVNKQDKYESTALHRAALSGHCEVITMLLTTLSSFDLANDFQDTSLLKGSKNSSINAVKLIKYLISKFPNESKFQRALGNEFMRQKQYSDARVAFDLSVLITLKSIGATEVDDISTDVVCDDCGNSIHGCHYKCTLCGWNHDMCSTCFQKLNHSHAPEEMIKIPSEPLM
jgi:hypothetical protein